ncbi:MAG: heme-copper oxidase subunit III, partial [Bacteroidota bacterium]|nr:heme-copper oxidase subunit III [Bacteroidota bacterium]
MSHSLEFANVVDQNKKIHPHKFTLWVGIASILMMFAGLTSAYLVKREQPGWTNFQVPLIFWYSTATILISSLTMYIALKSFRERSMIKYKRLVAVTALLGILFMVLQFFG